MKKIFINSQNVFVGAAFRTITNKGGRPIYNKPVYKVMSVADVYNETVANDYNLKDWEKCGRGAGYSIVFNKISGSLDSFPNKKIPSTINYWGGVCVLDIDYKKCEPTEADIQETFEMLGVALGDSVVCINRSGSGSGFHIMFYLDVNGVELLDSDYQAIYSRLIEYVLECVVDDTKLSGAMLECGKRFAHVCKTIEGVVDWHNSKLTQNIFLTTIHGTQRFDKGILIDEDTLLDIREQYTISEQEHKVSRKRSGSNSRSCSVKSNVGGSMKIHKTDTLDSLDRVDNSDGSISYYYQNDPKDEITFTSDNKISHIRYDSRFYLAAIVKYIWGEKDGEKKLREWITDSQNLWETISSLRSTEVFVSSYGVSIVNRLTGGSVVDGNTFKVELSSTEYLADKMDTIFDASLKNDKLSIVSSCGTGKTVMVYEFARRWNAENKYVILVTHMRANMVNAYNEFEALREKDMHSAFSSGVEFTKIGSKGFGGSIPKDEHGNVVDGNFICVVDSYVNYVRLGLLDLDKYVVVHDEIHDVMSAKYRNTTYANYVETILENEKKWVYLTGTPGLEKYVLQPDRILLFDKNIVTMKYSGYIGWDKYATLFIADMFKQYADEYNIQVMYDYANTEVSDRVCDEYESATGKKLKLNLFFKNGGNSVDDFLNYKFGKERHSIISAYGCTGNSYMIPTDGKCNGIDIPDWKSKTMLIIVCDNALSGAQAAKRFRNYNMIDKTIVFYGTKCMVGEEDENEFDVDSYINDEITEDYAAFCMTNHALDKNILSYLHRSKTDFNGLDVVHRELYQQSFWCERLERTLKKLIERLNNNHIESECNWTIWKGKTVNNKRYVVIDLLVDLVELMVNSDRSYNLPTDEFEAIRLKYAFEYGAVTFSKNYKLAKCVYSLRKYGEDGFNAVLDAICGEINYNVNRAIKDVKSITRMNPLLLITSKKRKGFSNVLYLNGDKLVPTAQLNGNGKKEVYNVEVYRDVTTVLKTELYYKLKEYNDSGEIKDVNDMKIVLDQKIRGWNMLARNVNTNDDILFDAFCEAESAKGDVVLPFNGGQLIEEEYACTVMGERVEADTLIKQPCVLSEDYVVKLWESVGAEDKAAIDAAFDGHKYYLVSTDGDKDKGAYIIRDDRVVEKNSLKGQKSSGSESDTASASGDESASSSASSSATNGLLGGDVNGAAEAGRKSGALGGNNNGGGAAGGKKGKKVYVNTCVEGYDGSVYASEFVWDTKKDAAMAIFGKWNGNSRKKLKALFEDDTLHLV